MASIQCHKPCEDKSHHDGHGGSFGQKLTGLFKGNHHHSNEATKTHTQYYKQTDVLSQSGHVTAKSGTHNCIQPRTATYPRTKREHKVTLFQKIKDGVSGHSSDDNCSSGSESGSDSDNENCRKRKASTITCLL